mmetsp:Transcript_4814/g.15789  ORF Transcript_4814/g.15789 Transcript_4814/m.15789 type:complete len:204 (-) Transcript_4814:378-989(-)
MPRRHVAASLAAQAASGPARGPKSIAAFSLAAASSRFVPSRSKFRATTTNGAAQDGPASSAAKAKAHSSPLGSTAAVDAASRSRQRSSSPKSSTTETTPPPRAATAETRAASSQTTCRRAATPRVASARVEDVAFFAADAARAPAAPRATASSGLGPFCESPPGGEKTRGLRARKASRRALEWSFEVPPLRRASKMASRSAAR